MVMKARRKAVILELVEQEAITSQEQLRERLRSRGIEATQATMSRDIRELSLVKRAIDGAYRRPGADTAGGNAETALRRAVEEYLRTQERVEQLIVLKTDPGQAQPLAIAIDRARVPEIAGTIGGDDTILVICRSANDAAALIDRFGAIVESRQIASRQHESRQVAPRQIRSRQSGSREIGSRQIESQQT
jgi:transcriptional regulator of arginine metabolism